MQRVFILTLTVFLLSTSPALVEGQRTGIRSNLLTSPVWLEANLKKPGIIVIHVGRSKKDFDAGHISGARFIAINDLVATRDGALNELPPVAKLTEVFSGAGVTDLSRIVLYSDSYNLLAARAYFTLDYLGFGDRASLLDGGLEKWKKDKRPMSSQNAPDQRGAMTVRLNPSVVATRQVVEDLSWAITSTNTPGFALIDARPRSEFTGELAGDGVKRGGHIPGAANVYWNEMNLVSTDDPVLRPAGELLKIYQAAGAVRGSRIVTYCRTGMQASHTYFVAKYLGYDVRLYDGSFMEWSNKEGLAVENGSKTK